MSTAQDFTCSNPAPSVPQLGCCNPSPIPTEVFVVGQYPWYGFANDHRENVSQIDYCARFLYARVICNNARFDGTPIDSAGIDHRLNHWVGSLASDPWVSNDTPKNPGGSLFGCNLISAFSGVDSRVHVYGPSSYLLTWTNTNHQIGGTISLEYGEPYSFANYFSDLTALRDQTDLAAIPFPAPGNTRRITHSYDALGGVITGDATVQTFTVGPDTPCVPGRIFEGFVERVGGIINVGAPLLIKSKVSWGAVPVCLYHATWSPVQGSSTACQHISGYKKVSTHSGDGFGFGSGPSNPCDGVVAPCESSSVVGPTTFNGDSATGIVKDCQCPP